MNEINPYQSSREVAAPTYPSKLPIRATGVLTADDAIAALKATGMWQPWRGTLFVGTLAVIIALLIGFLRGSDFILTGIVMAISLLLVATTAIRARYSFDKSWNARPEHRQPIAWTFSDEGLFVEAANSKHLHLWGAFIRAQFTPELVILVQHGDAMLNFVPRRYFEHEGDWNAVIQLVSAKLPTSHPQTIYI